MMYRPMLFPEGRTTAEEDSFVRERNARYGRLRGCLGKIQYFSKEKADETARKMKLFPYLCGFCNCYHLSKKVNKCQ